MLSFFLRFISILDFYDKDCLHLSDFGCFEFIDMFYNLFCDLPASVPLRRRYCSPPASSDEEGDSTASVRSYVASQAYVPPVKLLRKKPRDNLKGRARAKGSVTFIQV